MHAQITTAKRKREDEGALRFPHQIPAHFCVRKILYKATRWHIPAQRQRPEAAETSCFLAYLKFDH